MDSEKSAFVPAVLRLRLSDFVVKKMKSVQEIFFLYTADPLRLPHHVVPASSASCFDRDQKEINQVLPPEKKVARSSSVTRWRSDLLYEIDKMWRMHNGT